MVVVTPRRALASLRVAAAARTRAASPATPLGLRMPGEADAFDDDAPTCPAVAVVSPAPGDAPLGHDEPAPLPPPPAASVAIDPDLRLDEQTGRLRERLGAVRPALARLRGELARSRLLGDRALLELALADVQRALVQARRSVRAMAAELAELDHEAQSLGERAVQLAADGRILR